MRALLVLPHILLVPFFAFADEMTVILELQARIQALLAEISAVRLEIDVANTHQEPAPYDTCPSFPRTLRPGMSGPDVQELQQFLLLTTDFSGDTTMYFGVKTQTAVQSFQCREMQLCSGSATINGFGMVGPRTRESLRRVCAGAPAPQAYEQALDTNTLVCGQPPMPVCAEGLSCIQTLPPAQTYADELTLQEAGALSLHSGVCVCGDNGIPCL